MKSEGIPIIDAHVGRGGSGHLSLGVGDQLDQIDVSRVERAAACPADHYVAAPNREGSALLLEAVAGLPALDFAREP
jgi:hypothetical protein